MATTDSDPLKLAFITPGVTAAQQPGREHEDDSIRNTYPNATVIHTPERGANDYILQKIREQVTRNGPLKEIIIDAHGNSLFQNASDTAPTSDAFISTNTFLNSLLAMQEKIGHKIADRIVFNGCNVFTDLNPEWVNYLSKTAKDLNAELLGPTQTLWADSTGQHGAFARFSPDGSISRDAMSASSFSLALTTLRYKAVAFLHGQKDETAGMNNSDAWFQCYNGQSNAAGAACLEHKTDQTIRALEVTKQTVNTGVESVYVPNDIPEHLKLSALGLKGWQNVIERLEIPGSKIPPQTLAKMHAWYGSVTGNLFQEQAAIEAHEAFIRGLSPKDRQALERTIAAYKAEQVAPGARNDSRNVGPLKAASNEGHVGSVSQTPNSRPQVMHPQV